MAYPNVIYGDFGDEKKTSTAKIGNLPLGQLMILPDGRKFRHSKVGATAAAAGGLYQGPAAVADTMYAGDLVAATATVGAISVTITTGGTTAVAANFYDDGYLVTASSTGAGIGYVYKVRTASSAAAGSTSSTVSLADNETIVVATEGGTTKVGLRANDYSLVILTTANTVGVNTIAGVACATAAASSYIWLQRSGVCTIKADNTSVVVGTPIGASTTVAGAAARLAGTASAAVAKSVGQIGMAVTVSSSAEYGLYDLQLE